MGASASMRPASVAPQAGGTTAPPPEVTVESHPRITVTERSGGGRITFPAGATRTLDKVGEPATADRLALASALEDVVTSVVRLGARKADGAPSVQDAIERLVEAAPDPLPLGIDRWIGRLRSALARRDVDTLARVLDGAARVSEDMQSNEPGTQALRRIVSWLGATQDMAGDVEPIYERVLVEIGREWLAGLNRSGIERRYLVDLGSGDVYREERPRGELAASVGPCPRIVSVGFAEVELGAQPRRIRLLQYAVSPNVSEEDWSQIVDASARSFAPLARTYREALDAFPGLAEPFALLAPSRCDTEDGLLPYDNEDVPLPIAHADDPGGAAALEALGQQTKVEWLAGRLIDAEGRLMLLPCAAATQQEGTWTLHRVR
jgi:hypothetical protein